MVIVAVDGVKVSSSSSKSRLKGVRENDKSDRTLTVLSIEKNTMEMCLSNPTFWCTPVAASGGIFGFSALSWNDDGLDSMKENEVTGDAPKLKNSIVVRESYGLPKSFKLKIKDSKFGPVVEGLGPRSSLKGQVFSRDLILELDGEVCSSKKMVINALGKQHRKNAIRLLTMHVEEQSFPELRVYREVQGSVDEMKMGVKRTDKGLLITSVKSESCFLCRVFAGDVITEINNTSISGLSTEDTAKVLRSLKKDDSEMVKFRLLEDSPFCTPVSKKVRERLKGKQVVE